MCYVDCCVGGVGEVDVGVVVELYLFVGGVEW